ncbi:MAG: Flp family type IVb pilin [Alphaproteobacteria bacterium]|nr:Flp family type IVb pilin [Alphaproteobacteria bacterium]MBV9063010.1 Flp family type IVb pilin [Alphaproteobacteria bacterium]
MGPPARPTVLSHASRRSTAHPDVARSPLREFADNNNGATAIEYAMVATMISIVILPSIGQITTSLEGFFSAVLAGFH